ncbi:MAG: hypothetical protein KC766_39135 [Myxococcales bacterium]|nr:hypothetical protein [Myxococcales bacterium]
MERITLIDALPEPKRSQARELFGALLAQGRKRAEALTVAVQQLVADSHEREPSASLESMQQLLEQQRRADAKRAQMRAPVVIYRRLFVTD